VDEHDILMSRLREMLATTDGPPPEFIELAKRMFGLRTVDAELAALIADSDVEAGAVAVRGGAETRLLTFESADLAIEIEVSRTGRSRRVLGQLVPAVAASRRRRARHHRMVWHRLSAPRFACRAQTMRVGAQAGGLAGVPPSRPRITFPKPGISSVVLSIIVLSASGGSQLSCWLIRATSAPICGAEKDVPLHSAQAFFANV
jgi:hypothetical protein